MFILGAADSIFEIIGPIMVGPSSSHTAGAVRIGLFAHGLCEKPKFVRVLLHGSFADTYRGHGTDKAIVAGLLGMSTDDERIKDSIQIAKDVGLNVLIETTDLGPRYHPNTAKIVIDCENEKIVVVGSSVGGGNITIVELNGYPVEISGEYPTVLIMLHDILGALSKITKLIADAQVNIASVKASRVSFGDLMLAVFENDSMIPPDILNKLRDLDFVEWVRQVKACA